MIYVPDRVWYCHATGVAEDEFSFISKHGPPVRQERQTDSKKVKEHTKRMNEHNAAVWRKTEEGQMKVWREQYEQQRLMKEAANTFLVEFVKLAAGSFAANIVVGIC